jgi:hypothetical protein
MTPEQVYYGAGEAVLKNRSNVLKAAFANNPKRFQGKMPKPLSPPKAALIKEPPKLGCGALIP